MKQKSIALILAALLAFSVLLSACGNNSTATNDNQTTTEDSTAAVENDAETAGDDADTEEDAEAPVEEDADTAEESTETEIKWSITIPGKSGSLCNSPTYIAYEKGFFAEEGIDAELISADSETKKVGLNNGTISTVNGDFEFFPSIEQGVNVSVVGGLHQGCIKINVLPDSDIQTAEDLKGKTIGVDEIGGTPYQAALLWLGYNGISTDEVTFLPFNDGSLELEALYSGAIDAAALWDPLASVAEKDGSTRTILDIGKDEPFAGHFCCFLYASNKVLEEQPELIAAELRAYRKAQNWIYENPEEAVAIVTEKQYVSIEDHDLAVELVKSYGYPSTEVYESGAFDVKGDVEYFASNLYDIGYLQTAPEEYVELAYKDVDLTLGQ